MGRKRKREKKGKETRRGRKGDERKRLKQKRITEGKDWIDR